MPFSLVLALLLLAGCSSTDSFPSRDLSGPWFRIKDDAVSKEAIESYRMVTGRQEWDSVDELPFDDGVSAYRIHYHGFFELIIDDSGYVRQFKDYRSPLTVAPRPAYAMPRGLPEEFRARQD